MASVPEPMEVLEIGASFADQPVRHSTSPAGVAPSHAPPPSGHPTLDRLQKKAAELQKAEAKLTDAWAQVRGFATRISPLIPGIPLGVIAAVALGGPNGHEVGAPAFLAAMGLSAPLTYLTTRGLEALTKRHFRGDPLYRRLLEACAALGSVSESLAEPLDEALEAYFSMRALAAEPVWQRTGIPVKDLLTDTSKRLLDLLDWARRLQLVAVRVQRVGEGSSPVRAETAAHLEAQVRQFAAAAEVFVQTEAKLTRAFSALSANRSVGTAAQEQFREVSATLDALTEVLSAQSEEDTTVPRGESPREDVLTVGAGRGL